jgi:hypothetical protein
MPRVANKIREAQKDLAENRERDTEERQERKQIRQEEQEERGQVRQEEREDRKRPQAGARG